MPIPAQSDSWVGEIPGRKKIPTEAFDALWFEKIRGVEAGRSVRGLRLISLPLTNTAI